MTAKEYLDRYAEILPEGHKPTQTEYRHAQELADSITLNGGVLVKVDANGVPVTDAAGRPVRPEYIIIRGGRFVIGRKGRIWRFVRRDMPKNPLDPGQSSRARNNRVEMWSGRWHKREKLGTNDVGYAKAIHWVAVDPHINRRRADQSAIEFYTTERGYKHPFDPPDRPSKREVAMLDRKAAVTAAVVWARMGEVAAETGMDVGKLRANSGMAPPADAPAVQPPAPADDGGDLEALPWNQLQARAASLGVPANQKKPDLIRAIRAALQ